MSKHLRQRKRSTSRMPEQSHPGLHSESSDDNRNLPVMEMEGEKAAQVGRHWYSFDPHEKFTDRVSMTRTTRSATAAASTSTSSTSSPTQQRRRVSRLPRECTGQKTLSVFFWESLQNKDINPAYIEWVENSDGVFHLKDTDMMAHLWGEAKGNNNMTYEKMGRAIRYCYTNNTLIKEKGRRRYRFGPNAVIRK